MLAQSSFLTFLTLQLARIHGQLYPITSNPPHTQGPRRPDMTEQDQLPSKRRSS